MKSRIAAVAVSLGLILPSLAAAQEDAYPNRPVRLLVPASAGGVTDLVARITADYLSARFKQQFVVENRTGAGGSLATEAVAKAQPDGYTLGILASGNVVINPFIYKSTQFDAKEDLVPVAPIAEAPQVLAVNKNISVKSLKDLIALAKAKPKTLSYATAGVGTTMHLAGDRFARLAGVELIHVTYRGAAPAVTDVVAGTVQIIPVSAGPIMGFARSGQLRVLVAASPRRLKHFPDVPTSAEAGLPGYEMTTWFGVFAPKGTPDSIVKSLHQAVSEMLTDSASVKRLEGNFLDLMPMEQSQFSRFVADEFPKWKDAVNAAGIKLQ